MFDNIICIVLVSIILLMMYMRKPKSKKHETFEEHKNKRI